MSLKYTKLEVESPTDSWQGIFHLAVPTIKRLITRSICLTKMEDACCLRIYLSLIEMVRPQEFEQGIVGGKEIISTSLAITSELIGLTSDAFVGLAPFTKGKILGAARVFSLYLEVQRR